MKIVLRIVMAFLLSACAAPVPAESSSPPPGIPTMGVSQMGEMHDFWRVYPGASKDMPNARYKTVITVSEADISPYCRAKITAFYPDTAVTLFDESFRFPQSFTYAGNIENEYKKFTGVLRCEADDSVTVQLPLKNEAP